MARLHTFTFRVTEQEKDDIEALAAKFQRSSSDVIRLLIREAHGHLQKTDSIDPWREEEIVTDIVSDYMARYGG